MYRIRLDQAVNISLPDKFGLDVTGTCMVTVGKDKTMVITLIGGTEMAA